MRFSLAMQQQATCLHRSIITKPTLPPSRSKEAVYLVGRLAECLYELRELATKSLLSLVTSMRYLGRPAVQWSVAPLPAHLSQLFRRVSFRRSTARAKIFWHMV